MIAALRVNLKILWNHIMKYFRIKHDQCDSIICYWSLCPRKHWDPGCVSNWFVYLATISLQLEQSVINIYTKIYNVDKNYKDLVSHIFYWQYVLEECFSWYRNASSNLQHEMQCPTNITYEVWSLNTANMSSLILLASCIYNIFLSNCFLLKTLQNTYKKHYEWWRIRL